MIDAPKHRHMLRLRAALVMIVIATLMFAGCSETTTVENAGAVETAPATMTAQQPANTAGVAQQTTSDATAPPADRQGTTTSGSPAAVSSSTVSGDPTSGLDTTPVEESPESREDTDYTFTDTSLASAESDSSSRKNHIQVINQADGKLKLKADVQLNRISGDRVAPSNLAVAYGSCTDCQTIAVALQINLISRSATYLAPENYAIAVNYECDNCYTVARAIQYTYSVDDPTQVPPEVDDLIKEFDKEFKAIRQEKDLGIEEIEQRINAVIERFRELAASLKDDRQETMEATTPDATPPAGAGTPTVEASPLTTETPMVNSTPAGETPTETVAPSATPTETLPESTPTVVTTTTP